MDDDVTDYRPDERIPLLPVLIFAGSLCAMIAYALVMSTLPDPGGRPAQALDGRAASE